MTWTRLAPNVYAPRTYRTREVWSTMRVLGYTRSASATAVLRSWKARVRRRA